MTEIHFSEWEILSFRARTGPVDRSPCPGIPAPRLPLCPSAHADLVVAGDVFAREDPVRAFHVNLRKVT